MTMYLRRRASFSAGFASAPSGEAGGGHNYLCELTVGGAIDPKTGMVVNIRDVDAVLKSRVTSRLDGKLLDRDVAAFRDIPPTLEHLTRFVWDECRAALPPEGQLARVTLWATPTRRADCSRLAPDGAFMERQDPMLSVTRAYDFSASHRLHSSHLSDEENDVIFGKCNWPNGHGHNYEVEVTVTGALDPKTGQIVDTDALDRLVDEVVLKPYDHRHLNHDTPDFADLNPTSENLTKVIWDNLARRFPNADLGGAKLHKVAVRETARNYFEYYSEEPSGRGTKT